MRDAGAADGAAGRREGPSGDAARCIRDHVAEVAAAHREHLAALAAAEQRFLASRAGFLVESTHEVEDGRLVVPLMETARRSRAGRSFDEDAVHAVWENRLDAFGPGFEWAETHIRSPRIGTGPALLLARVTDLDLDAGGGGCGSLRAVVRLPTHGPSDEDDGRGSALAETLAESALQAMAFYLTALGCTLDRDGWRFEPVAPVEPLRRTGRGTLASGEVALELFVRELHLEPLPTLLARVVCTVGGDPVYEAEALGARLVPGWPLDSMPERVPPVREDRAVSSLGGPRLDERAILALALGRHSEALGEMYLPFDGHRRAPRLPAPPFTGISRIVRLDGPIGELRVGMTVEAEMDIFPDAWYFRDSGNDTMPFCVLLEAGLQPSGLPACYSAVESRTDKDLFLRNLDGRCTVHREIRSSDSTLQLRSVTRLTRVARSGLTIILAYEIECDIDGEPIFSVDTVFGIFTREALAEQRGLPHHIAEESAPPEQVPATALDEGQGAGLARGRLRMLDRVTGYWPNGGRQGLGRIRGERDISAGDWYFKAHFFQDPVQPGSLGLEAMLQLLRVFALQAGLDRDMTAPRFEPVVVGREFQWKYRGQVRPSNTLVTVEVEITALERDPAGPCVMGDGRLWADGLCIYEAPGLGVRLVDDAPLAPPHNIGAHDVETLDPAVDPWVLDHCPSFTVPTLPLMSMVERMASAAQRTAPDRVVVGLEDVRVEGWLTLDQPRRLHAEVRGSGDVRTVMLSAWRESPRRELSRFAPVARGRVLLGDQYGEPPSELPPLGDLRPRPTPYETGDMPHGPAFQIMVSLEEGESGARGILDAARRDVPRGLLHQALLDGALHGLPHAEPQRWFPGIPAGVIGVPYRIPYLHLFAPSPRSGHVRCDMRFDGFDGAERFLAMRVQCVVEDKVWLDMRLVDILIPGGPLAKWPPMARLAFSRNGVYLPGVGLSRSAAGATVLNLEDLRAADWIKGTVARIYAVTGDDPSRLARNVVVKDHVAQLTRIHPSRIEVRERDPVAADPAGTVWRTVAVPSTEPLGRYPVAVMGSEGGVEAESAGPVGLDLAPILPFWHRALGTLPAPVEALQAGLARQFVHRVVVHDPAASSALRGRSVLFLANHQVQLESLPFMFIAAGLFDTLPIAISRTDHGRRWLGPLGAAIFAHPDVRDPGNFVDLDPREHATLQPILAELRSRMKREQASLLVHVEGELQRAAGKRVECMSSVWIELCIQSGTPIVPVRFTGGLPLVPADRDLQFPVGFGRQDYHLGRPILSDDLAALPFSEGRRVVLEALNAVGPPLEEERPAPHDEEFARAVRAWQQLGCTEVQGALLETMARTDDPLLHALVGLARAGQRDVRGLTRASEPEREWIERMAAIVLPDRAR